MRRAGSSLTSFTHSRLAGLEVEDSGVAEILSELCQRCVPLNNLFCTKERS